MKAAAAAPDDARWDRSSSHQRRVLSSRGHPFHSRFAAPRRNQLRRLLAPRDFVTLVLFAPGEGEPALELPLDPRYNRTRRLSRARDGNRARRRVRLPGRSQPEPRIAHPPFDPGRLLLDPYGISVAVSTPGARDGAGRFERLRCRSWKRVRLGHEHPLNIPLADTVISRSTCAASLARNVGVAHPGTYRGLQRDPVSPGAGVTRRR